MSQQRDGGSGSARARPDASMSLLTDLMANAAEEGYADAAARRSRRAGPRHRGPVLVTGLLLLGLLLVVAALQVRDRAPAVAETRSRLIGEIDDRTASTDRLQRQVGRLRGEVESARRAQLRTTEVGAAASSRLDRLGQVTGVSPLRGPGVRVVVDDADDDVPRAEGVASEEGRVLDYDLQRLVNGLWAAGAEAVAIDGQRLTALSAIRAAGDAVLVDYRPLSPPYEVTAIGDSAQLELAFVEEPVGQYFHMLEETYGIRFDVNPVERLRLPQGSTVTLRYARPAEGVQ
ncbi:MAG: DUF881 domain-containing protein [Actinomycetes bacterium]